MSGISDGTHASVGGGGGPAGGAPVASVAASSSGSDNQMQGVTILNSMIVGAQSATAGAEDIGSAVSEGVEEGQFNPNASIQDGGGNGSGNGDGADDGGDNGPGNNQDVTSCGGDTSDSYDSTSHASSSGDVAKLMGSTLDASEMEAKAAQVESVDGIKDALEGTNAQMSNSIEAAKKTEEGTDVAAEGAIGGAVVSIAAVGLGAYSAKGMSPEDAETQQGLKNTDAALHPKPTVEEIKAPPTDHTVPEPDEADNGVYENSGDVEMSDMSTKPREITSMSSPPSGGTQEDDIDDEEDEDDENPTSTSSTSTAAPAPSTTTASAASSAPETASATSEKAAETAVSAAPASAAPEKALYSPQDKNDLLTNGYLKDDPGGVKTKAIVSDLNPKETAQLTKSHAESQQVFDNKQNTRLQANNTTRQVDEALGNALSTGITQSANIDAASFTKDAQILQAMAQSLSSSIQADQSIISMAASILNSAATLVSGLAGNISNLTVRNS